MTSAIRYDRIEHPHVSIPIRTPVGGIELVEVWREDRFDPDPGGDTVYLVLDFADEAKLAPMTPDEPVRYEPTGGLALELQAIHRTTGEGLALPHRRTVNPVVPDDPASLPVETPTGGRSYSTRPLTGLIHLPVSPRRANRD